MSGSKGSTNKYTPEQKQKRAHQIILNRRKFRSMTFPVSTRKTTGNTNVGLSAV